ncbi:MAG TPA: hypothetical protein VFJ00_02300, partial [Candidatus Limnocylindria bacterium]|nr:hypothetical protein [Candidatus Limnocylindria bacterium]
MSPSWLLIVCALATAAAAAATFFVPDILTGPAVTNGNARGTALIMLLVGMPVLGSSVWLEQRASRWAPMVRIGVLSYLAYNCFLFLSLTPFNRL